MPTDWSREEILPTEWERIPLNPTLWTPGDPITPSGLLLLQTGYSLLLQDDATALALQ